MAFQEADMQEQTYPPKRPNMEHFGNAEARQERHEVKAQPARAADAQQNVPRQRPAEKPAP
jgi:hypothetical protein